MKNTLYLIVLLLACSCASIRQRNDTTALNQIFGNGLIAFIGEEKLIDK